MFAKFETSVAVYAGGAYRNLTCVEQDFNRFSGTVSFHARNGTEYYLAVGGTYYSAVGDYTLVISEEDNCGNILSNDSCGSATTVNETSFPLFSSSTRAATTTKYESFGGSCYLHDDWRTAWYHLKPSLSASTACARLTFNSNSYGRVFALAGTCENSTCIGVTNGYSSSLSFKVDPTQSLLFAVSGRERGHDFKVDLDVFECTEHDSCSMAKSYGSLPVIDRTTNEFAASAYADSYRSGFACPSFPRDGKGTWYRIEGDGSCLTVARWGTIRSYIGIYEGSDCGRLRCITHQRGGQSLSFVASTGVSI